MGEMPLFRFSKKKKALQSLKKSDNIAESAEILTNYNVISMPKDNNHNSFNQSLNHLDEDGELPWGWITYNRGFTEPIQQKYNELQRLWVDTRTGTPQELYATLSSFVSYMEAIKELCESKGECYEFWFNEILTGKDYLKKRKQELVRLSKALHGSGSG